MRVLFTGMGGELGTRVASMLEGVPGVDELWGIDVDPPRRLLRRARFVRVESEDRVRTAEVVRELRPSVVVHLGTFEPSARSSPRRAVARTATLTVGLAQALDEVGGVERMVVRSGIEVYGRRRNSPVRPDEAVPVDPTTPFGHSLRHVEVVATDVARRSGAQLTVLRFAPLVGPHFPSPLGRLLRLPVVPVATLGGGPFSVLHQEDAARAVVAAIDADVEGPVNVVADGAVSAAQAARLGGRVALPVFGLGWRAARAAAEVAGAPLPEHVRELLIRGRTADASRAAEVLGPPTRTTREVVAQLYDWPAVTHLRDLEQVDR